MEEESKAEDMIADDQEGAQKGITERSELEQKIVLPKPVNLKQATSHLRIEALRRYRLRHSFDIEDYDDRSGSGDQKTKHQKLNEDLVNANRNEDGTSVNIEQEVIAQSEPSTVDKSCNNFAEQHSPSECYSDDDLVTWGETSSSISLISMDGNLFSLNHSNVVVTLDGEELGFGSSEFSPIGSHFVAPLAYPANSTLYYQGSPVSSYSDHMSISPLPFDTSDTPGASMFNIPAGLGRAAEGSTPQTAMDGQQDGGHVPEEGVAQEETQQSEDQPIPADDTTPTQVADQESTSDSAATSLVDMGTETQAVADQIEGDQSNNAVESEEQGKSETEDGEPQSQDPISDQTEAVSADQQESTEGETTAATDNQQAETKENDDNAEKALAETTGQDSTAQESAANENAAQESAAQESAAQESGAQESGEQGSAVQETAETTQPAEQTAETDNTTAIGETQDKGEEETGEGGEPTAEVVEKDISEVKAETGDETGSKKDEEEVNAWGESKEDLTDTIDPKFFYNNEQHTSGAFVQDESGLPQDLLTLNHSYGYDCTKRANLHILDEATVCFVAGNLVELLNLVTKEQTYIRSSGGGGIGAIAVHPSRKYFAVAEKGNAPNINIYEYPSLKLYRMLRGGTEQYYSYIDFSPDGELLASQGGESDYMLTVWRWKQEKIVLRSKAFSQEVFRATFSAELEGQLTTAGTSHIRFWKMADTFTGLKLQGQLGKFGRTEISDIEGYVELPDGKVLSGCEWGNLLVWDGGLIKVEISRKGGKSCHHGPIQQILLDEGELMTVGVDGYIRVWDFETIDTAEGVDEAGQFEMDPMNELQVGHDVKLKSIVKSVDTENEPTIWYAQDANGGIWKLDLSFSHTSLSPEKLMTYHAGPIWNADTSPVSHLVATTGQDNTVRIFDYVSRKQLCEAGYSAPGTSLVWAPQIVDPKGSTVIVGFHDGVVRLMTVSTLMEHVHGHKGKEEECEIVLRQAFKPHTGAVTCLAIDGKGEVLVTGSDDGTVFFMTVGSTYEPVGFVKMPAPVRSIQWSPEKFKKTTLLIFCDGGCAVELTAPEPGTFDTSHTFQITGLHMKTFQFKSIKSHLRHEEDLARQAKEEEERKKKEEEEKKKRIERGLETESDSGEEEQAAAPKKPQTPWVPYIPADPSPILTGFYTEEGKFWVSMGGFDAGYLYECKFLSDEEKANMPADDVDKPLRAVSVLDSRDIPITEITFSSKLDQVIMGMENGAVRIQQMDPETQEKDLGLMGAYWMLTVHDNHYGKITRLLSSHDDAYILTVGTDGNFFAFNVMGQEEIRERVASAKAKLPSAKAKEEDTVADDIDDPNAYSIEDAKQKAEHDKMIRLAEEKKKDVRRHIAKMRRDFRALLEKNKALPEHLQLQRGEFEMDREIKEELQKQIEDKIELTKKEMLWDSEKHRIALEKLRAKFKDVVECERIVVRSFNSPHEVATFRTAKLSDDFFSMKAGFERRKTTFISGPSRDPTRDLKTGQTKQTESGQSVTDVPDSTESKMKTSLKGSMADRISQALHKVDEKKQQRAIRKAQWDELLASKPDDDYEDPADVAAIKEAKENMGDYKLKTAADYVVPDHMRMNVEKARGRLLIIKDLIHQYKYDFNAEVLSLRDRKITLLDQLLELVKQLNDVQSELTPDKRLPVPHIPELHPEEVPERQLEYTRETLLKFKMEHEARELAAKKGSQTGGFGGFGGSGEETKPAPTPAGTPKQVTSLSGLTKSDTNITSEPGQQAEGESELTDLEIQIRQATEVRLLYERDCILRNVKELKQHFDADLRLLRHDKFLLDIVMKNADLRHVTLFEELVLLKEFEKSEDVLAAKVESKEQEKLEMQAKVLDCQTKLENKKKDIEKLQEKEKALHASFLTSIGDNNKFSDYLQKVFKKKIKRAKKKTTDADGSDEESDDDSDDESDWDESDEESESEAGGYDLDVCPSGCDQTIYDNTCQMREKKLDIEELLTEEKKASEVLKKELDSLQKKSKVIDSGLQMAENNLEAFQLEKQQKINELDVVVTLKLHQIQYMVNGALPPELSNTLVFESTGVNRLQQRIKELQHEKSMQKRHMKESRRQHVQLIKDRRRMEANISEMEEECNHTMIAKFGCIVDLEKLETITVNRNIEELKEKLRNTEIQNSEEITDWIEKINMKKEEITGLIRENTGKLNQLCILTEEKKSLENSLDARQKHVGGEYSGVRKSDVREKQRLIQLVQLQAHEIDALKEEITLLSRKGGHILPPAQPPMPQSASL